MENTDDKVAGESPSKEEVSLEDDQDLSDLSLPDPEFPRIHDLEKIKDPSLNYKSEPIAEPATPQLAFSMFMSFRELGQMNIPDVINKKRCVYD